MSGATEIYICEPGQPVEQGRIEYSAKIRSRYDAEKDALDRCAADPSIGKIVYYAVSEDGDFKSILTYDNPRARKVKKHCVPAGAVSRNTVKKGRRKQQKNPGLIDRLRRVFEE